MKSRIMYIEYKGDRLPGPARIGRVTFSKTGKTLYYGDRVSQRIKGGGLAESNHLEIETDELYWISGPHKDGGDRLFGERIPIEIDEDVREEYWLNIRQMPERKNETSYF